MSKISRRTFVEGAGVGLAATQLPLSGQKPEAAAAIVAPGPVPKSKIKLTVNGAEHELEVEDRWTLVEVLRDHLNLTGTKIGCDRGECGACTVLLDGKSTYSCSQLAVWMDGRAIQTVEGLRKNGKLDPLQQAFIDHDGPQCGFCTSGQLMSAKALLLRNGKPTLDDVRHGMAGNICRCGGYNHYAEAVVAAGERGNA